MIAFLLAVATLPTFAAFDVVLIGALVAFGAIVELANAFFDVFAPNVLLRMFMASVAGGAAVVVAHMAGDTTRVVIAVEHKILVVVKRCRRPLFLAVALQAIAGNLLVQGVSG